MRGSRAVPIVCQTPLDVGRVWIGQERFRAASVKTGEALERTEDVRIMGHQRISSKRGGLTASVAAVALVLTGVPTAGFALVVLASLAWGWRHYAAVDQVAYRTAIGGLQDVPLPDGSVITLSSDSRILVTLSRSERHIDLQQGEAFFKVAKDPSRPFVVSAGDRRAIAVGTRYDVRRDAADLRVIVTQGVVRLESDNGPGGHRRPAFDRITPQVGGHAASHDCARGCPRSAGRNQHAPFAMGIDRVVGVAFGRPGPGKARSYRPRHARRTTQPGRAVRRRPGLRRPRLLRPPDHPHAAPGPDGRRGHAVHLVLLGSGGVHAQPGRG